MRLFVIFQHVFQDAWRFIPDYKEFFKKLNQSNGFLEILSDSFVAWLHVHLTSFAFLRIFRSIHLHELTISIPQTFFGFVIGDGNIFGPPLRAITADGTQKSVATADTFFLCLCRDISFLYRKEIQFHSSVSTTTDHSIAN